MIMTLTVRLNELQWFGLVRYCNVLFSHQNSIIIMIIISIFV